MRINNPLRFKKQTTPAADAGEVLVYPKSDGNLYSKSDTQGEAPIVPVTTGTSAPAMPRVGEVWIDTGTTVSQSPSIVVSTSDPALADPGLWIQTGLGSDGTGVTFWIEDGL